ICVIILEEFTRQYNTTTYRIIFRDLELLKTDDKQKILREISALTGKEILCYRIREISYRDMIAKIDITYKG
ncbi:MAG: hypothetical protein GX876_13580, partial [Bacteroidales bacterium]|nr:hypothetical protein [Bacteroidales bacterium]